MAKLLWMILAMGLVVVLGGAACGGDDDDDGGEDVTLTVGETVEATEAGDDGGEEDVDQLELSAYFDDVMAIAARTNSELDAINDELDGATFAAEEDEVAANVGAFESAGRTLEASALDMSGLTPPAIVESEHEAFAQALVSYVQVLTALSSDLVGVTTAEDLTAATSLHSDEITAAQTEAGTTCKALEATGAEYIDGLDLACPGDD